MDKMDGMD